MGFTRGFVMGATWLFAAASWSCGGAETCVGSACEQAPIVAKGTFAAKQGSNVSGTVTLVERGGKVTLTADVKGATPGPHGIHIHAKGDCSAPDFSTAGGHFNPKGTPHACPPDDKRHAGDFGNVDIAADGTGHLEITSDLVTLRPGERSVTGLAVILHDDADDCHTEPSGHSGMRLGCAVIRLE